MSYDDRFAPDNGGGEDDFVDDTLAWERFKRGELKPSGDVVTADLPIFQDQVMVPKINGQGVTPAKWDWRIVMAWIIFVIYGVVLEMWTLFDGSPSTPPLTWVVVRWVPEVIGIGFTMWLMYHFATEYWKGAKINAD